MSPCIARGTPGLSCDRLGTYRAGGWVGTLCAAPRPALARGASMRPRALLAPGVPEAGCPEQRAGNGGTGGASLPRGLPEHIPMGRCSNGAAAHPWQSAANSRRGSAIAAARSAIGRHHDGASKPHVPAARTAATKAPARTAAKIDFCRRARRGGLPTARNIVPTKQALSGDFLPSIVCLTS